MAKVFVISIFIFFAGATLYPVNAIIVGVPVAAALIKVVLVIIGIASVPATAISTVINADRYRASKLKFIVYTLLTLLIILAVVAIIAYVVLQITGTSDT